MRKTNRKKLFLSLLLITVTVGASLSAVSVLRTSATCPSCLPPRFIYSAKYLCGIGATGTAGFYETTINAHNPSISANASIFSVLTSHAMLPSSPQDAPVKVLLPNQMILLTLRSFEVDCNTILGGLFGISEGFVSLITDSSNLDVVAVYTVSPTIRPCGNTGCSFIAGNATSVQVLTILPKPLV